MTIVMVIKLEATKEGAVCNKAAAQLALQQETCTLTAGGWQHGYSMWVVPFFILVFQQDDKLQSQGTEMNGAKGSGQLPSIIFLEVMISKFLRKKIMLPKLVTLKGNEIAVLRQLAVTSKEIQKAW